MREPNYINSGNLAWAINSKGSSRLSYEYYSGRSYGLMRLWRISTLVVI